jgi:hypothetical protein
MAIYKTKETIIAKGMENFTLPYKGKVLEKTFDKGVIVTGNLNNYDRQNLFIVEEKVAKDTIDKDTKQPYTGLVYFALDPNKLEKVEEENQQNLLAGRSNVELTAEDKFYEMFGIKKTDGSGWGLQSRPVGRLLVAFVLVAGYFAYKKYKK